MYEEDVGSRVLNLLHFVDGFVSSSKEKLVRVVKLGSEECVELRFICIAVEFYDVWLKKP